MTNVVMFLILAVAAMLAVGVGKMFYEVLFPPKLTEAQRQALLAADQGHGLE